MEILKDKWIIYDGNCGLCLRSKRLLVSMGWFPEKKFLDYHHLKDDLKRIINSARFRYEMALVDEKTRETKYGLEGIISVFAEKTPALAKLKTTGKLFKVLESLYHTISYNRYFLFPDSSVIKCACEPPFKAETYRSWLILSIVFSSIISYLFGWSVAPIFEGESMDFALKTLFLVGIGWVIQLGLTLVMLDRQTYLDYSRHLCLIMVVGVMVLIPSIIISLFLHIEAVKWMPLMSIAISSAVMLRMHTRRVRVMRLTQWWTFSWFLVLQISATLLIYLFQFRFK
ncbi:DCC1-like thiol-disulfide oxidoreductase family protein [Roseivirga misakiensis]|uniref:DUF393 domain-containing protein n=1 Tax=Roseivirga misakiensis TaxID=1563681 RepID=A0A1E5SKT9_9BACT|nr:DCC1-like thiol-disulfide oxidoreductase family protein [Roseivirga misakiensis]OEJ99721.1 hypothetical protein BFP71_09130 [Roseivirga misakiensis]